jgi:hypothetical protein
MDRELPVVVIRSPQIGIPKPTLEPRRLDTLSIPSIRPSDIITLKGSPDLLKSAEKKKNK